MIVELFWLLDINGKYLKSGKKSSSAVKNP